MANSRLRPDLAMDSTALDRVLGVRVGVVDGAITRAAAEYT